MTTATTSVLETLHLPKGRKRASIHNEILHHIQTGDTAHFRFLRGYLAACLWSSIDDEGDPLDRNHDISDIATESLLSAWADCSHFIRECETDLVHLDDDLNGHNFWLTRGRFGSGYNSDVGVMAVIPRSR